MSEWKLVKQVFKQIFRNNACKQIVGLIVILFRWSDLQMMSARNFEIGKSLLYWSGTVSLQIGLDNWFLNSRTTGKIYSDIKFQAQGPYKRKVSEIA